MIRLRLGVDDVARTRFAAPGPYCELSVTAQVIQQPASPFRRLCAARKVRLPASAGHLLELVPAVGAPGFMSHISIDGGPPPSQSKMHDLLSRLSVLACARSVRVSAKAGMATALAPARWRMKWRRDMP